MTRRTTGERQPGAHPTSKLLYKGLQSQLSLTSSQRHWQGPCRQPSLRAHRRRHHRKRTRNSTPQVFELTTTLGALHAHRPRPFRPPPLRSLRPLSGHRFRHLRRPPRRSRRRPRVRRRQRQWPAHSPHTTIICTPPRACRRRPRFPLRPHREAQQKHVRPHRQQRRGAEKERRRWWSSRRPQLQPAAQRSARA